MAYGKDLIAQMRRSLFVRGVNLPPPGPGIVGRFRNIVALLCRGLAQHAVRDWTATSFVEIIVANLRRRAERFAALKARFDAGVPPPPPRAREREAADPVAERPFDFVPRERGWLKRTTEHDGAAAFGQLRDLLAEPEMATFIAADPRVGRLLRPLWWMLSPKLGLPDVLAAPPPSLPGVVHAPQPKGPAAPPRARRRRVERVVRMPGVSRSGSTPVLA